VRRAERIGGCEEKAQEGYTNEEHGDSESQDRKHPEVELSANDKRVNEAKRFELICE
jgi:hypothetical protein